MGFVPRALSKFLGALHGYHETKLLHDFRSQKNNTMKRAMVKLRRERDKGVMTLFVVCMGIYLEDKTEGSLQRNIIKMSLASHNAVVPVGELYCGND